MTYDCRTCGACCVGKLDDGDGFADVSDTRGRLGRWCKQVWRDLVVQP